MSKRIYLAGPDVFLVNARDVGARKRAICARHGLVGVFPADEEEAWIRSTAPERGLAISRAMERVMQSCDAMIVNLTPFRGPSADVGSAYEMGFMRALGRPIFAYSNDDRPFLDRVAAFCDGADVRPTGEPEDPDGMAIEPFELHDNLMLAGGVIASGGWMSPRPHRMPNATPRLSLSSAVSPRSGGAVFGRPPYTAPHHPSG